MPSVHNVYDHFADASHYRVNDGSSWQSRVTANLYDSFSQEWKMMLKVDISIKGNISISKS